MTGTPEYILTRAEALVRAFAGLLDVPEIKLVDSTPNGGSTDCQSTIWIPFQDPEAYLVTEHELSHHLFETDPMLAQRYLTILLDRLLNRAGIRSGTNEALPYEKHLLSIFHHLWNVLEDWRCCWLWKQLYPGGGELLEQRWRDIVEYEVPENRIRENLVTCLQCYAAGREVPGCSQTFEECKLAMRRALNLVEGVDATACLAITSRLIQEIIDELLANNPPPPSKEEDSPSPRGRQERREEEAKHVLQILADAVPRRGNTALPEQEPTDGLGGNDTQPSGNQKESRSAGQLLVIQQLEKADTKDTDESGHTPFQTMLMQGADAMEERLEEARRAMMRNQDTPDEANTQLHLGWSRQFGIEVVHVLPSRTLPPPSPVAYENRRILEQLRMKKRRRRDYEGEFDTDSFLAALGAGELDRPFYDKVIKIARFELLFLFDVSGSMTIGQALALTERALADSVFAVQALRSKAHMWAFSDKLYMFDELGSPLQASGIRHGSTMTVQALDVAHQWGKKAPDKRAVMLVTDGWPTSLRAHNSTGNALDDLHAVLDEMRRDKIPLSVLGIRHFNQTIDAAKAMYDRAFGAGGYGSVGSFDELAVQLPRAVRVLAEAHVLKGVRRS